MTTRLLRLVPLVAAPLLLAGVVPAAQGESGPAPAPAPVAAAPLPRGSVVAAPPTAPSAPPLQGVRPAQPSAARRPPTAAPAAPAPRSATCPAGPAARRARVVALVRPALRELGYRVEVRGPRSGVLGMTFRDSRRIVLYVRPGQSPQRLARVLLHELGHAVDHQTGSRRDRDRWLAQRGMTGTRWWPRAGRPETTSGAGDFAEAVVGAFLPGQDLRTPLGGPLRAADLREARRRVPAALRDRAEQLRLVLAPGRAACGGEATS